MMKTRFAAILILIAGLCLLLPAYAQRGGGETRMPGRVLDITPGSLVTRIALYYKAAVNAPGEVPAEFAQQAARMKEYADRLKNENKTEAAEKLYSLIQELQRWREIDSVVTDWSQVEVIGLRKTPLSEIKKDMKLRLTIEVTGQQSPDAIPAQGSLCKDITQAGPKVDNTLRGYLDSTARRSMFYDIVGDVADLNPLVVKVGNNKIRVNTPVQFGFYKIEQMTPRDLRPGDRLITSVQTGVNRVTIKRLLANPDHGELPFEPNAVD